jgi:hypothetical protein
MYQYFIGPERAISVGYSQLYRGIQGLQLYRRSETRKLIELKPSF